VSQVDRRSAILRPTSFTQPVFKGALVEARVVVLVHVVRNRDVLHGELGCYVLTDDARFDHDVVDLEVEVGVFNSLSDDCSRVGVKSQFEGVKAELEFEPCQESL